MISVTELRKALGETIGGDLQKLGFKKDTRNIQLRKKFKNRNEITVSFICYDYKPFRVEFKLILVFVIKEIDIEAVKIYDVIGEHYNPGWTIIIGECDYHPEGRQLEPKFRKALTHIVVDQQTMMEEINDCREILSQEIIPLFESFSNLDMFQNFCLNNFSEVKRLEFLIPSLIALKLHSKEALLTLADYFWKELDLETCNEDYIIRKFVAYMINHAKG